MADVEVKQEMTELELAQALLKAAKAGDTAKMKQLSEQIAKGASTKIAAEQKAKQEKREKLTAEIKNAVQALVDKYTDAIAEVAGNGLWFSRDFETTELQVSLLKPARKVVKVGAGSGGHVGKTGTKSAELLSLYGAEASDTEGQTWQEKWDSNSDGNFRYYQVKVKLDKVHADRTAVPAQ